MKNEVFAEVKAVKDATNPNGEFEVILSAPTLDRDGEIVDAGCFNPLPEHITFDIDHGMSVRSTVGSGRPFYDGDLLKVRGTFASTELGQETRTLVTEGHIRTTSVAFMNPTREEKDGVPHIVAATLLNGAFVPIPANAEAMVLSAKGNEKVGARNSRSDAETLQAAHDLLVKLGVSCETKTEGEGAEEADPPEKSAPADPEVKAAAPAAANPPADAEVARAFAVMAEAQAALLT